MKRIVPFAGLALVLAGFTSCSTVDDGTSSATADSGAASFKATADADREARQTGTAITPYPFETCAVQFHKPFKDGKPKHRRVYKGQEVLFCCTPCVKAFDMNPEPYMPRILAAASASQ
ncbi:MAG: hypothetical protein AAF357_04610 [Verrucomicrobiota bacterium]